MAKKIRVGLVFGGRSAEHEVSLQSARNVLDALDGGKYEVSLIGIDKTGRWHLNERSAFLLNAEDPRLISLNRASDEVTLAPRGGSGSLINVSRHEDAGGLDVVFPVLHGPYGEDGSVQGLCRLAGVPCVGAGVLGSAVGMDKDVMKRLLRDAGIPNARFLCIRRADGRPSFAEASDALGLPLFVKPANLGSSVGVSKVRTEEEYGKALDLAFRYDMKVLVEEFIDGREVECAVLGNDSPEASVPGEILPSHDFYSYEAKYIDEHGAALEIPARLPPAATEAVRRMAVDAFRALCCQGMARVDMFVRRDGAVVMNEINTIPGFTRISMYPKLWEASGVSYAALVDRLIALALQRHEAEADLDTEVRL